MVRAPRTPRRCEWSKAYTGAIKPEYIAYHDTEWGVPVTDDKTLFEHIVLDGAQCGLSWSTVLAKRPAYRVAFLQWDIDAVAAMVRRSLSLVACVRHGRAHDQTAVCAACRRRRMWRG